jgi:hypothetical protein
MKPLLDSGTTEIFINQDFMHQSGLKTCALAMPIKVYNIDGTQKAVSEVCNLDKATLIIGHPWLHKRNLEINWHTGEVKMTQCLRECNVFI